MTEEKDAIVFNLSDCWSVFIKHFFVILLVGIFGSVGTYVYGAVLTEPVYKSTATLYVLKQESRSDYSYTQSDFNLAMNVVNDCIYMIRSRAVLDKTIADLGLNISYSKLYNSISTNNPANTRMLEVSLVADKAETAKRILDRVCENAAEKISKTLGLNQVSIYNWGNVNMTPANRISMQRMVAIGFGASFLMYFIFLILFLFDDKVRTEEEVQRYLNLTVLGVIPNVQEVESKKFKKKMHYEADDKYCAETMSKSHPVTDRSGTEAESILAVTKKKGGDSHE